MSNTDKPSADTAKTDGPSAEVMAQKADAGGNMMGQREAPSAPPEDSEAATVFEPEAADPGADTVAATMAEAQPMPNFTRFRIIPGGLQVDNIYIPEDVVHEELRAQLVIRKGMPQTVRQALSEELMRHALSKEAK